MPWRAEVNEADWERLGPPLSAGDVQSFNHALKNWLGPLRDEWLSEDAFHAAATVACLKVLGDRDMTEPSALRYAQWYWPYHAKLAGSNNSHGLQDILKGFLDSSCELFKRWSRDIVSGEAGLRSDDPHWRIHGLASDVQLDVKASVADFPSPLLVICQWSLSEHLNDALSSLDLRALNSMHNCRGETPLCLSVKAGNTHMVDQLLDWGADPNSAPRTIRPLDIAVERGHYILAETLIVAEASIHARGKHELTPLQTAAKYSNDEVAVLLIRLGADVDVQNSHEGTPLQIAAARGYHSLVNILLNYNAQVNVAQGDESALVKAARNGHTTIIETLLDAQRKPAVPSELPFVNLALFEAVRSRRLDTSKLLLAYGADADFEGSKKVGHSLVAAALNGDHKIIRLLIQHGADVNRFSEPHKTALAAVAAKCWWDLGTAKVLLENGAKLQVGRVGDAFKALDHARDTGGRMRLLLEKYTSTKRSLTGMARPKI